MLLVPLLDKEGLGAVDDTRYKLILKIKKKIYQKTMKKFLQFALIIFLTVSLPSCSKKDEKTNAELSYIKAMKSLKNKNYIEAAEAFAKIDEEFPFSKWALKAQTMAVYTYYKEEEYVKLLQIVDDFVKLNPANENVPYMLYMKGLSYYNQVPNIARAQDPTKQASFTFRELIARFPNSDYAQDAKDKLSFVDEHLAGAKMSIGRYQMQTKNFVGAINNFIEVTQLYRFSKQLPEAYFRLTEIYYKIGLESEALESFKILKINYPQSTWLDLSQKIDPELFQ